LKGIVDKNEDNSNTWVEFPKVENEKEEEENESDEQENTI